MSGAQRRSVILGTGSELPNKVITNEDLEKMVDTSDEWITVRTGIRERRVLEEGKGNADMAYRAAQRALADAGVEANDLDAIIMGTVTPDYPFPSSACVLEDMLGARGAFSFDVGAACSGFLNAISVADSFIRTGKANKALVVGSDALSKIAQPVSFSAMPPVRWCWALQKTVAVEFSAPSCGPMVRTSSSSMFPLAVRSNQRGRKPSRETSTPSR